MVLVLLVGFGVSLAWVAFLSWVIARFAFRALPPAPRAAWTAAGSFGLACLISIALQLWAMSTATGLALRLAFDFTAFLFYAAAAAVDFLLLRRHFARGWVADDAVGQAFR